MLSGGTITPAEGLTLTRIGYGAMQLAGPNVFGPPKDRDEAVAVLRAAVAAGVTHIDTADFYGPAVTNELIKEALHPSRCEKENIAFVPFFPLGGFSPLQSHILTDVAARLGASPQQVALAWLLRRSPTTVLIPGTSSVAHLRENIAAADLELPADFGTPDELITSVVDVSPYVERKRKALEAHASQGENIFLLRLPEEAQHRAFASESFVRHFSSVPAPDQEDDLFAGLR